MKTVQAILVLGGIVLFTSIAISGTAHACGFEKEDKHTKVDSPKETRTVQSLPASEPKQVAANPNEVYGPPTPENLLGAAMTLSQSGAR